MKIIHFVFIGYNCCEGLVESEIDGVFSLSKQLLFQFAVRFQPFAFIVMIGHHIVVTYINLQRVLIFELYRFVDELIRLRLLLSHVSAEKLLRIKLLLESDCLRIEFHLSYVFNWDSKLN